MRRWSDAGLLPARRVGRRALKAHPDMFQHTSVDF